MTFFKSGLTLEQVKTEYRALCKKYHPDLHGGDTSENWVRIMQQINAEYALASANARYAEEPAKRAKYGKSAPTATDYADMAAVDERIRQAIEKIITLAGLEIEICGLWVWVGGETKPVKDTLKAAGYMWAAKKEKWYFAGVPASHRGHWDMDTIRTRYGSSKVRKDEDKETKTNTARPSYMPA